MTYSCSEEDLFEEELNLRSFSKRNMSNRMEDFGNEDNNENSDPVIEKILGGTHSENVHGTYCDFNVFVSWTDGYTSGAHNSDEISKITASATSNHYCPLKIVDY